MAGGAIEDSPPALRVPPVGAAIPAAADEGAITMGSMDNALAGDQRPPSLALLRTHRGEILEAAARRGVSNIRVFGSVARGDATPISDVDLLVDFEKGHRGLDLFAFAREVEDLLGYHVEIGTTLDEAIRSKVEEQVVPL